MPEETKRVHFYDQQFLREGDFNAEQDYHIRMRRLHNRSLHTSGVVEGLVVTIKSDQEITISAGMAFGSAGREVVLAESLDVLVDTAIPGNKFVTIKYVEEQTDPPPPDEIITEGDRTRWTESSLVELTDNVPADPGEQLILAVLTIDNNIIEGVSDGTAPNHRRISGAAGRITIRDSNFTEAEWVSIDLEASRKIRVDGSLRIETDSFLDFGSEVRQMINLWGGGPNADYGIGIQGSTQYYRTAGNFAWYIGGTHNNAELNAGGGALAMVIRRPDGNVGIGTADPQTRLHIIGGSDVSPTGGGFLTLGSLSSSNIAIDDNEITARNNGQVSSLFMQQNGGHLIINGTNAANSNVGIGTSSPGAKLDVVGTLRVVNQGAGKILLNLSSERSWAFQQLGTGASTALELKSIGGGGNKNFIISTTGRVGIGTTSPGARLDIEGRLHLYSEDNVWGALKCPNGVLRVRDTKIEVWDGKSIDIRNSQNSTNSFLNGNGDSYLNRLSGNVGIGKPASASFKLDVNGKVRASSFQTSDKRFKKNIKTLTDVLDKIEQIRGVSFEWNKISEQHGHTPGESEIGVIAQEIEAVYPELITSWDEKNYRAVEYGRMSAILIQAVKELKAEIDSLKKTISGVAKSSGGKKRSKGK